MKIILIALVASLIAIEFPLYKQCDARWANQKIGTSAKTICQVGCLISSISMGLSGHKKAYNPSTINAWLKTHSGYAQGDLFVWASINSLGATFKGFIPNKSIGANLAAGRLVFINVRGGRHWVLAKSISGNYNQQGTKISVNDPGYSKTSYYLSQVVQGNTGVYDIK